MTTLSEALAPRSDQLNGDDLISGPRTIVFTAGRATKDGRETKLVLNFEGDNGKPWKPCKTMGRAMVMAWGLTDENFEQEIVGKSVRVFRDPDVTFGDAAVGGIRISHMSHIDKSAHVSLTTSRGQKRKFVFQPLPKTVADDAQPRQQGRQTPKQWTDEHLDVIDTATSLEELDAIEKAGARALAKLTAEHPDLASEVTHAYQLRREAMSQEKRTESGYGEGFAERGRGAA